MSQTSVNAGGQAAAIAGQVADSMEGQDILSGFNKDTVQIPFGYGVRSKPGGQDTDYLIATGLSNFGPTTRIAGINLFSLYHNRAGSADSGGNYSGDQGASGLLANSSMQVGRRIRAWVPVEVAVAAGDPAYCRGVATGTFTQGVWSGTGYNAAAAVPSYHIDCSAQGQFRTASVTAADGTTKVAILEFDGSNKP